MTAVPFPVIPRGATVAPRLVRVGGDLVSTLGGPTQRITRVGTRYAVDVQLPALDADCAAQWLGAAGQAEAMGATLLLTMPQMIEAARTMAGVRGGGTAGTNVVNIQGAPPPLGAWFSVSYGGRNYLHLVIGVGPGSHVNVSPLLRVTFPNNTALEVAAPKLEGFTDDVAWSLDYFRFVGHRFTITENA